MTNLLRDIERFKILARTIKNPHSLATLREILGEAERHLARLQQESDGILTRRK